MSQGQTKNKRSDSGTADDAIRQILIIEDDLILLNSLSEHLNEAGKKSSPAIKIEIATELHIEGAKNRLIVKNESFDGLIIDLRLPKNQKDWNTLQQLIQERRSLLEKIIENTDYSTEILDIDTLDLRRQMDYIDEKIEELIQLEGGFEVLKEYAKHCEQKQLTLPVIFLTGRGVDELKERCKSVVDQRFFRWFDKPTDEMDIIQELLGFWDITIRI